MLITYDVCDKPSCLSKIMKSNLVYFVLTVVSTKANLGVKCCTLNNIQFNLYIYDNLTQFRKEKLFDPTSHLRR